MAFLFTDCYKRRLKNVSITSTHVICTTPAAVRQTGPGLIAKAGVTPVLNSFSGPVRVSGRLHKAGTGYGGRLTTWHWGSRHKVRARSQDQLQ